MEAKRIHITGNAGSGKTTLARKVSEKTNLPVYSLDSIVWKAGWVKTPIEERRQLERALIEKPVWIIEGVSNQVRERADMVVFLDRSRLRCLVRCLQRNIPYLFRSRPDLPENCPEIRIVGTLLKIIWKFPVLVGQKISAEAGRRDGYHVLRTDRDIAQFLSEFRPQ